MVLKVRAKLLTIRLGWEDANRPVTTSTTTTSIRQEPKQLPRKPALAPDFTREDDDDDDDEAYISLPTQQPPCSSTSSSHRIPSQEAQTEQSKASESFSWRVCWININCQLSRRKYWNSLKEASIACPLFRIETYGAHTGRELQQDGSNRSSAALMLSSPHYI